MGGGEPEVVCIASNCETVRVVLLGRRRNDPDGEPGTEGVSTILSSVKGSRYSLGTMRWRIFRKMGQEVGVRGQEFRLAADIENSIAFIIFQIGTSE